ncbi:MAG: hypothetical protein QOF06_1507 [Solirubrobacterales bacterium]|nr:hypothetical protein [Solirubrobacterales bacterium]
MERLRAIGGLVAVVVAILAVKTNEQAEEAAVAQHEANVAQQKLAAVTDRVKELIPEEEAAAIKESGEKVEKELRAPRTRHHKI